MLNDAPFPVGRSTKELATAGERQRVFKSFIVGGVKHRDLMSTLNDIKSVCTDLKCGDYSAFEDIYYTEE